MAYTKYQIFPEHDNKFASSIIKDYDLADSGFTQTVEHPYHSEHGVRPNVVRIEVLSPAARRRYLNGGLMAGTVSFQSQRDLCKQLMIDSFADGNVWEPFYGIVDMSSMDGFGFSMSSGWGANNNKYGALASIGNKILTLIGTAESGVGNAAKKITSNIPVANVIGAIAGGAANVLGKVTSEIPTLLKNVPDVANAALSASGLNAQTSGASTVKEYTGSNFATPRTITCKWYMPEQDNLARLSIGRLIRMAYARGFTQGVSAATMKKICNLAVNATLNNMATAVSTNASAVGLTASGLGEKITAKVTEVQSALIKQGSPYLSALVGDFGGVAGAAMSTFGNSLTIDPMPVRLTVGSILDIEPLVITEVSISCSKEQFVSQDGSHIPLFVTAKISFDMWMMPNPSTGFVEFLGDPLFNMESATAAQDVSKK